MNDRKEVILKKVILSFCLSVFFSSISAVLIPLFLPLVATEKGISAYFVGIILGIRALTACITSPLLRYLLMKISAETITFWAIIIQAATQYAFAFACITKNKKWFIAMALLA